MGAIAYLKEQCGWSRGVREVLAKYVLSMKKGRYILQRIFKRW